MTTRDEAVEQLRMIRSMMERATIFRALSGETALMGGAAALAAAWLSEGRIGWSWASYWLVGLGLVLMFNIFQILRASSIHGRIFWSSGLRTALRGALPSLIAGGFLGLLYIRRGGAEGVNLAASIWILHYGIALLAIREFAPRSMIWLGWTFLVFGLVCLAGSAALSDFLTCQMRLVSGSHLMAIAFGGFHLIYGGIIVTTKQRDDHPRMIDFSQLDKLIHEKGRLSIMTLLASRVEPWAFQDLKTQLEMSDGNLITHLRTLEKAEFIGGEKFTGDGRPQTLYTLTPTGRQAFVAYLGILEKILDLGK